MSGGKRRTHRANDRVQRFLREQRDLVEADFREIEARYRREIEREERDTSRPTPPPVLSPLPRVRREDGDALLELAIEHSAHVAQDARISAEARREAKQALRDRGVQFNREPRSIHVDPPRGRIGSIAKPRAKGKPDQPQPFTYTRQGQSRWHERG